jgi:hypothetical protein
MIRFCTKYQKLFFVMFMLQLAFLCSGCGALTWLTDAGNILPIVGTMITGILTLVGGLTGATLPAAIATIVVGVISAALKGVADIEAMVNEYKQNPSPTLLGSIEAGVKAVTDNINQFLTDTLGTIANTALQGKLKAILALVLTEIEAFASLLPALKVKAGQNLTVTVPMTSKESKAAYNAIITAPTGDHAVDAMLAKLPKL